MKRAGETLIEVITAMAIFGVVFAGISDFMANQTLALAHAKDREKILYYAQKWVNSNDITIEDADGGNITFSYTDDVLTVSKGNISMAFKLQ